VSGHAERGRRGELFYAGRSPVVLASASPRRVQLLRQVGLEFTVADPGPDRPWPGEAEPRHGVRALALDKARRVAHARPGAVVIGADTVVMARGVRLGKPIDVADALAMLERLQGRTHDVWSGVAVVRGGDQRTAAEVTQVQFAKLDRATLEAYVRTGEPMDKAGAYGIQGLAAAFVKRIEGDYCSVVGLPLARLRAVLAEFA
jgi:nucleoside triphosphate pyrophosphatase